MSIKIEEGDIDQIIALEKQIPEFDQAFDRDAFKQRLENRKYLILVAFYEGQIVGYSVSYDRYQDGSLYCWIAGVLPDFRRYGIYQEIASYRSNWALEYGFFSLTIKTKNKFRAMLSYLIKDGWLLEAVQPNLKNAEENRILARKILT